MIAVLALLCLQIRQPPQPMPDPAVELRGSINRILAEKRFDRSYLSSAPFDPEKLDPLLIQARRETIRPSLGKACARFLRPGETSMLCLHFQSFPTDREKLRIALHDQENRVVRTALAGLHS